MSRIFIVGDIHGCSRTFKSLVTEKIRLNKRDKLYLLGDYIDRGPDSMGVVDFILELREAGNRVHTLRGNHEEMLLRSADGPNSFDRWFENGGDNTLDSFGIESIHELAPQYFNFFKRTKYYIQTKKFTLVHAGLNFRDKNPYKDKMSMLWIRRMEFDPEILGDRLLIHGHTPLAKDLVIGQDLKSRINLDSGCVFKDREGLGYLTALNITDRQFISIRNIDT